jgi:hypothetical protein
MARKRRNKSALIRKAFDELGHDAKPSAVVAHLKGKRVVVKVGLVNAVKMKLGKSNGASIDIDALISAKKLVNQLGGIENAKRLIDTLAKLS